MTSLAFMLLDVPEPVWKTSIGNWSSNLPSATSRQAASMASTWASSSGFLPEPVNLPRSRLATSAGQLHQPHGVDQFGMQRPAGDRKILDRPLSLGTVIGLGRHLHVAHRVLFNSKVVHWSEIREIVAGWSGRSAVIVVIRRLGFECSEWLIRPMPLIRFVHCVGTQNRGTPRLSRRAGGRWP